ncbi:GspE/PulE family protein [Chloroflexota bacterium]
MSSADISSQKRVGDMFVEAKIIDRTQWELALELELADERTAEDILLSQKLVTPQQLAIFTGLRYGVPYVNLKKQAVDADALEKISESTARKYGVLPLKLTDTGLLLAMSNPEDINIMQELATLTRRRIDPVVCIEQDIMEAIDTHYRVSGEIEKQLSQIPTGARESGQAEKRVSADAIAQAPVVRAVDLLIRQGVRDRASDIHIEPQDDRLRIRFRIDGILHETMTLPRNVHSPLISRIKIMAGMNIAERRRSQDGQITYHDGDKEVDIRVATTNTIQGEMAVLRILDKTFAFRALPELGFAPDTLKKYEDALKTPFGMILISGPTGSGKTTTLYASVNKIDSVGRNILTIEDPVEYHFNNVNQMQVNINAGVTFASELRAAMRLDPDVILVGEIRDRETVEIAIQAALTGHLVLSSVHANDTVGVIFRLMDLGAEPFLISSAIIAVIAQRMVRRICPNCATLVTASGEEQLAYQRDMGEDRKEFLYGTGCSVCANTGYLGRTGIYEVMPITEAMRKMILANANQDDMRRQAIEDGMVSIWHDGMLKVKAGITTPYEVIRNVYSIG